MGMQTLLDYISTVTAHQGLVCAFHILKQLIVPLKPAANTARLTSLGSFQKLTGITVRRRCWTA